MFFLKKSLPSNGATLPVPNPKTFGLGSLVARVLYFMLLFHFLWASWLDFGPEKAQLDQTRNDAVPAVTEQIANSLRENRQDIRSLTLINFAGEPTDSISDHLRQRLGSAGTFLLADRSLFDKIRRKLLLSQSETDDLGVALQRGKRNKTDAVLYGTVHTFESEKSRAMIHIEYHLVDCRTGETVYSGIYDNRADMPLSMAIPAIISDIASAIPTDGAWWLQLFGCVLIVLLLPIFTFNFLVIMAEKRSGMIKAFVLAIYIGIGVMFAWILITPNWESYTSLALFALLLVFVVWYNVQLVAFAVRQNETAN